MAHGLEVRVPFLDNDLVDFAVKVPVSFKLKNITAVPRINENEPGSKQDLFYEQHRDGKIILRKVMERYIPTDITNGAKQGFSAPDATWFKGESIDYVKKIIFNNKSNIYDYFDPKAIQERVVEHLEGKMNRRLFIWSLLNFDSWCRAFL